VGSGALILVYQPQVASWDGQKRMTAFSAVSYRSSAQQKPLLGTIKIEADTSVSTTERLVRFENMKLTEVNIQGLAKESTRDVAAQIEKAIPDDERLIALDRVLANVDKSTLSARNIDGIKADPPPIFYSKTPALMVNIDGEPIWSPIKEVDLKTDAGRAIAGHEMVDEGGHDLGIRQTQQVADGRLLDPLGRGGQELVQHRLGIAHPAGGESGDEVDGRGIGVAHVRRQDRQSQPSLRSVHRAGRRTSAPLHCPP
jgi:hypothetical protein